MLYLSVVLVSLIVHLILLKLGRTDECLALKLFYYVNEELGIASLPYYSN